MSDQPFVYTTDHASALAGAMSSTRFARYLEAAGSEPAALQLYSWNTAASAAFYGPLQALEITLRNAIHERLSQTHGIRWFDDPNVLRAGEQRLVGAATQQLYDLGKKPTSGAVVAELSYWFWIALIANPYDATLWRSDLHKLFSPKVKDRHGLHEALDRLRTLRNRIAHHEPIFQRKLMDDYRRIRTILGMLDPSTLTWLDHHSTVGRVLATQPGDLTSF